MHATTLLSPATPMAACWSSALPLLLLLPLTIPFHLISAAKHGHAGPSRRPPSSSLPVPAAQNLSGCDIFTGSWVIDDDSVNSTGDYSGPSCPAIDPEFNCQLYGRPDGGYLRYKWQPAGCELPRFDGADFLARMRAKTVMFVGDSIGRNQWESLVCMLHAAAPQSPVQSAAGEPVSTYTFSEYALTIAFYRAPYLVDIDSVNGKKLLMLDDISGNARAWAGADLLIFNSGHWWTHTGGLQGWDYMVGGGEYYADMDRLTAYRRALTTWARWVDAYVDSNVTRVFFQGISPSHYNSKVWSNPISKNCYGETSPANTTLADMGPYVGQAEVLQAVINMVRALVRLLDITVLSQMRKDAHPSIFGGDLTPAQRASSNTTAAAAISDCSHWCLPGLPDTWNRLLYTQLFFS